MKKNRGRKFGLLLCALAVTGSRPFTPPPAAPPEASKKAPVRPDSSAPVQPGRIFDIPVVYNDQVARMIDAYCNRVHARFEEGLENAGRYEPLIRTTFQAEGLPEDLVYVAMIESSFRPMARSSARARGIWQFVKSTGHRFGLKSDSLIDERADPAKATLAAAKFWKTLYSEFGDWNLAMAAYNSGEGRVSSAIRRTGLDDYWDLCRQNALPRETCNYVPGVIAAGLIARDPRQYGFDVKPQDAPEFDTVVVDQPIDLRTLARRSDVDLGQLRELNPELRTTRVPARRSGYPLIVPTGDRAAIESTLDALPERSAGRSGSPRGRRRPPASREA